MTRKLLLGIFLLAPLGVFPFLRDTSARRVHDVPDQRFQSDPLTRDQELALACFSIFPSQAFPGGIPWEPMRDLGQQESAALEKLAESDPVAFLEQGLSRYRAEVQGYRCIFDKQEKVNGKLNARESIRVHFREQPFSVHMEWLEGGRAAKTLYNVADSDVLLQVRPTRLVSFTLPKKITDRDVAATSRFGVDKFGMYIGAKDTAYHMAKARENGTLHIKYLGVVRPKELGYRFCYKFVRSPYVTDEGLSGENLNELTIYIDVQTRLQVGSVLKDANGNLIAEYLFREIELNPPFDRKQFTTDGL